MQHFINVILAVIIGGMGWFGRELWSMIQNVQKQLDDFKQQVPQDYVPKEDYREDMDKVFTKLDRIIDKLNDKADRQRS